MRFGNNFIAFRNEATAEVIVAGGRIVVYKRSAVNGDGSGIGVVLVENVVFTVIGAFALEEASVDFNICSAGSINGGVSCSACGAAYGKVTFIYF